MTAAPRHALSLPSAQIPVLLRQALARHEQADIPAAEQLYEEVLRLDPFHFDALHLLGVVSLQTGRFQQGIALIAKAVNANPNVPAAYGNLGNGLSELGMYDRAVASYDKAIELDPDFTSAYDDRGDALTRLGRHEDALASYEGVVKRRAGDASVRFKCANTLMILGRPEEALIYFDKAAVLAPADAQIHNNRAEALRALGRIQESLSACDRAIALIPDYADAHVNKARALLIVEQYEQGWAEIEWRKRQSNGIPRSFPQPEWTGREDLNGKTLFLYPERNIGDLIQFCRYVRLASARGARVVLAAPESLHPFLKQLGPAIETTGEDDTPSHFDYHAALMSMPRAFGTAAATIPASIPYYFRADDDLVDKWRRKITGGGVKIGICWQNPGTGFAPGEFQPIAHIPGLRLFALQKPIDVSESNALHGMKIEDLSGEIANAPNELAETAAIMANMDLLIVPDCPLAHFAGALGRPVWLALRIVPDWRWQLAGEGSAWYPTARLFRKKIRGDWPGVFADIEQEALKL